MSAVIKSRKVPVSIRLPFILALFVTNVLAFTVPTSERTIQRYQVDSKKNLAFSDNFIHNVRSSQTSQLQYAKISVPQYRPSKCERKKRQSVSQKAVLNPVVLKASLSATAKLLSSIGLGALASPAGPKQFGKVLDGNAVSALSKLTYWLFQPCFLLCGVAGTLAATANKASGAGAAGWYFYLQHL